MVIDDSPLNLMPLSGILESHYAIQTTEVLDGASAINIYKKRLALTCCNRMYKLILTDIEMPEVDGFKVAESIL